MHNFHPFVAIFAKIDRKRCENEEPPDIWNKFTVCVVVPLDAKLKNYLENVSNLVKKILNITIKSILPLLLGAMILYWIYAEFDFSQVRVAFAEMDMFWFFISLLFGILSHVLRGWRWLLSLAPLGYYPRRDNCVYSIFIAYGANLVLPRVGEVSRCVVLDRYDSVPFAQSLGTVVTERLIDTVMVVLITVVAVVLQWHVFCDFVVAAGNGTGIASLSSFGGTAVVAAAAAGIALLLFLLLRKISVWSKVRSFFVHFIEGVTSLARMENGWLFVLETFGIWFCYFMQFYLCFFCFDFCSPLSLQAGLLLFVAGSIAVVVPTPNGAGPWHFAVIGIMTLYGLSTADASLFALIVHSTQTLLVALLGIYGIIMLQLKNCITIKK